MEKPFLQWRFIAEKEDNFSCFSSNSDIIITGNLQGRITVINLYNFTIYSEPINGISHIRGNIFAIFQSYTSIIEISSTYKIISTIKLKLKGVCNSYFWSKSSIYNQEILEIYKIEEREGEITQVIPYQNGLIVSSLLRSVLISKGSIIQIGKKERNGWFGACELNGSIFASRPLGNLWESNTEGVVMITTNYKIKSEKISFGILYPIQNYILSFDKENSGFILLDPIKKIIISSEVLTNNSIFYNFTNNKIYKYQDNTFYESKIISCFDQFHFLLKTNIRNAVLFCLEISELQHLEILQDLCRDIFTNNSLIEKELFDNFSNLIERLEQDMIFPKIQLQNEIIQRDELFDEFLKATSQENRFLKKKRKRKINKRFKNYYRKNFTWKIIANWLMYIILLKNQKLFTIQKFLKIANRSLDQKKFFAVANEEKLLINEIGSIL